VSLSLINPPTHIKLTERERRIVHEAAGAIQHKKRVASERRVRGTHRGVRCAGGCGTAFGKRRFDHNFSGGTLNEGWTCPNPDLCAQGPTEDHFCGMCHIERITASEIQPPPDPGAMPPVL